jgi:phosphonate transport system substrate-binding protein
MKLACVFAALIAVLAFAPVPAPRVEGTQQKAPQQKTLSLTFGVYQTDKATLMYRSFTPLIDALQTEMAAELGRPVDIQLTIFRTYDDGIDALCKGTVDFVHFGPASYIVAKARNPAIELLGMESENGSKRFQGVVIVAKDSPIQSLKDLKGKTFAFGDRNSTIGRWLIQAEMVKAGIRSVDLASFQYFERHDQVADVVLHGDFQAGSVKLSTFTKANAKNELREILRFENVTKPVVARQGLDREVFAAIQKSLFSLKDPALFTDLKISGFIETSDAEYQFVRDGMKVAETFESKRGS